MPEVLGKEEKIPINYLKIVHFLKERGGKNIFLTRNEYTHPGPIMTATDSNKNQHLNSKAYENHFH